MKKLKSADIIFVGGDWWISNMIKFFTRFRGEPPTTVHHVAGMIDDKTVEEALLTVKKTPFEKWEKKHKYYEIWRNETLTELDRQLISKIVQNYTGRFYGFWKIAFHALDGTLGKILGKNIYFFRKVLFIERYPICSWLWAFSYFKTLKYLFGATPNIVSPDDMYDHVDKSKDWVLIHKKWG